MILLCGGGYNISDKEVVSDIINISFNLNINENSNDIFNIEEKYFIKNAHNSWITGIIICDGDDNLNEFYEKLNAFKDDNILLSVSHDKKLKIWKENNNN